MTIEMEELLNICKKQKNIYIYGAGQNASRLYLFLQNYGIDVKSFLVTNMSDNPVTLFGQTVMTVDEFIESEHLILVPVIRVNKAYKEIFEQLFIHRIYDVYFLVEEQLEFIKKEVLDWKLKKIFDTGIYHLGENIPVESGHSILVMEDREKRNYQWRFRNAMPDEENITDISDVFLYKSALEEFEEQYGKYNTIQKTELRRVGYQSTYAVYMACSHVDKMNVQRKAFPWIIPIQVGATYADRDICELRDNTGENISERNKNYSECTALYWMWKNAPKTDYIGLCHYRRHFDLEENEIVLIESNNLDVLVTRPTFVNKTIRAFFCKLIPELDLNIMLEAIAKFYPDYLPAAKKFLEARFFPPCNLFIMKYDLFQEYAEFVFSTTFEIEKFYDNIRFQRKDRYIGFIIECLMGIFLMKNKKRLKVGYTDMRFYS